MVSDEARTKGRIIETSKPMTRQQALEKAQRLWAFTVPSTASMKRSSKWAFTRVFINWLIAGTDAQAPR
jgi:hypothetical protein